MSETLSNALNSGAFPFYESPLVKAFALPVMDKLNPVFPTQPPQARILEKFVKNFVKEMPGEQYRLATLQDDSLPWLIVFYAYHPERGKLVRVRKTYDLNRIPNVRERRAAAAVIVTKLNEALKNGWNPFTETTAKPLVERPSLISAFMKSYGVKIIGNAVESIKTYGSIANIFMQWLQDNELHTMAPEDFTPALFQEYLSERFAAGKGLRNLNAHISLVKAVFNKMRKPLRIITDNPLEGFPEYEVADSSYFEALTPDELRRIATHLKAVDERFFCFTNFIYYAYIRPGHLSGFRRGQIDFAGDVLQVKGTNTKGKKNAVKQLLLPHKASLLALGIDKLPDDWYIFSNDFAPGRAPLASLYTRAAERWNKYVVEELGIDKRMYALKHTSGQLYLTDNDNIDAGWLQRQMEHSSLAETEAYIAARKIKKIDESKARIDRYGSGEV